MEARADLAFRVNREMLGLLGWGRAILLQFAHPLVAAGVADHSHFNRAKAGRTRRLMQTVQTFLALSFGDPPEQRAAAGRINAIHTRVHGTLRQPAGPFPAGTGYSAEDPELLRWVHCTLVDSVMRVHELLIEPLSDAERDQLCAEAATIEPLLHIPDGFLPRSRTALEGYLSGMQASGAIVVTDAARLLARDLLDPPMAWMLSPAFRILRLFTVGLLPPPVRAGYGYTWTARDARALARAAWMLRSGRRVLPRVAWEWPAARRSPAIRPAEPSSMIEDPRESSHVLSTRPADNGAESLDATGGGAREPGYLHPRPHVH